MGRVYAVASAKGGVGKTTTTANVAAALADGDASVVAVDADLGMPNLAGAFGLDATPTIHDVLAGDVDVADAVHEGPGGVSVVPGSAALDDFRAADPSGLGDVVAELAAEYDYVLLDSGAGLNHDSLVPLDAADEVVLVTASTRDARGDTSKTREVSDRLGTPVVGIVVNRVADGAFDGLDDFDDLPVLGVVPDSPAVAAATEAGEPVVRSDPDSAASLAYRHVAMALSDDDEVPAAETPDIAAAAAEGTTESEADAEDGEGEADEADDDDGESEADDDDGESEADDDGESEADDDGESEADDDGESEADEEDDEADEEDDEADEEDDEADEEDDEADDGESEESIDELVDEAEGSDESGDESPGGAEGGTDGDDGSDSDDEDELEEPGVQETALFQSRPEDESDESDGSADEGNASKQKGFLSRLLGLD